MIGDKLVITDYHRAGAALIMEALRDRLAGSSRPLGVTVAGESGSGKSEIAACRAESLEAEGYVSVILGQDDYFKLPPRTNHRRREEEIEWVGPGEVRLDLMDEHLSALKSRPHEPLEKPLVDFPNDRIGSQVVRFEKLDVVIAEGTYTTLLSNADLRCFIDRNYRQTKKARLARGRDPDVKFLERVLEIEHGIISRHRERADLILDPPPEERG
jgi:uridine kinase